MKYFLIEESFNHREKDFVKAKIIDSDSVYNALNQYISMFGFTGDSILMVEFPKENEKPEEIPTMKDALFISRAGKTFPTEYQEKFTKDSETHDGVTQ